MCVALAVAMEGLWRSFFTLPNKEGDVCEEGWSTQAFFFRLRYHQAALCEGGGEGGVRALLVKYSVLSDAP